MLRQTHTVAELEVSSVVYDEIADSLRAAGYMHAINPSALTIDMTGIGLVHNPNTPPRGKRCDHCDVFCVACAYGSVHMNVNMPFEGYTHDQTGKVNWPEHNAKGHHHVMWNGSENETVACGSDRANELGQEAFVQARRDAGQRETDARPAENTRQVGGQHYGLSAMQHWDVVDLFKLDYFQGQITKYVFRWRDKNGIEDLEKAAHYLEKYIALEKKKLAPEDK